LLLGIAKSRLSNSSVQTAFKQLSPRSRPPPRARAAARRRAGRASEGRGDVWPRASGAGWAAVAPSDGPIANNRRLITHLSIHKSAAAVTIQLSMGIHVCVHTAVCCTKI
jgi:hypothetical protein